MREIQVKLKKKHLILAFFVFTFLMASQVLRPIIPLYIRSFGTSVTELGIISSGFGLGLAIFEPIWGTLSDRIGKKKILKHLTLFLVIITFSYTLCNNLLTFFLVKFLQGIIYCGLVVISRAYMADITPQSKRGGIFGVWWSTYALGSAVGSLTGGYVASITNYIIPFYVSSMASIFSFLIVFNIPETRRKKVLAKGGYIKNSSFKVLSILVPCFLISLFFFGRGVLTDLMPIFVNESAKIKATEMDLGLAFMIMYITLVITQLSFGALSDRIDRKNLIIVGLSLCGLTFSVFPWIENVSQLYVLVSLWAIGEAAVSPSMMALLTQNVPLNSLGNTIGIYGAFEDLGMLFGPLITGFVFDFYCIPSISFYLCAAIIFFDAFFALVLLNKPHT